MASSLHLNLNALMIQNELGKTSNLLADSMERLTTALRINTSADDPGQYGEVQNQTREIRALEQGIQNAQNAINLLQTGAATIREAEEILQQMRDLADESANGATNNEQRLLLDQEFEDKRHYLEQLFLDANYNDIGIFDVNTCANVSAGALITGGVHMFNLGFIPDAGGRPSGLNFQVEAYAFGSASLSQFGALTNIAGGLIPSGMVFTTSAAISQVDLTSAGLSGIQIQTSALAALATLDLAIDVAAREQVRVGSMIRNIEHRIDIMTDHAEYLTDHRESIQAVDFENETRVFAELQARLQSGVIALAQANLVPAALLSLLS